MSFHTNVQGSKGRDDVMSMSMSSAKLAEMPVRAREIRRFKDGFCGQRQKQGAGS